MNTERESAFAWMSDADLIAEARREAQRQTAEGDKRVRDDERGSRAMGADNYDCADLILTLIERAQQADPYARLARAIASAPTGKLGAITTAEGIREFVEAYAPAEETDR